MWCLKPVLVETPAGIGISAFSLLNMTLRRLLRVNLACIVGLAFIISLLPVARGANSDSAAGNSGPAPIIGLRTATINPSTGLVSLPTYTGGQSAQDVVQNQPAWVSTTVEDAPDTVRQFLVAVKVI